MKRGEVWTASGGSDYAAKARPVVIVQDDRFDGTQSVTICGLTTDPTDAPLFRPLIEPSEGNGLKSVSRLMADKVTTIRRSKLGQRLGRLADQDILRMNRALIVFLGLAASAAARVRVKRQARVPSAPRKR
jgi:mRNA interferase MazF